jgi:hypothetical protein
MWLQQAPSVYFTPHMGAGTTGSIDPMIGKYIWTQRIKPWSQEYAIVAASRWPGHGFKQVVASPGGLLVQATDSDSSGSTDEGLVWPQYLHFIHS